MELPTIDRTPIVIKNASMYYCKSTASGMNLSIRQVNQAGHVSTLLLKSVDQTQQS